MRLLRSSFFPHALFARADVLVVSAHPALFRAIQLAMLSGAAAATAALIRFLAGTPSGWIAYGAALLGYFLTVDLALIVILWLRPMTVIRKECLAGLARPGLPQS